MDMGEKHVASAARMLVCLASCGCWCTQTPMWVPGAAVVTTALGACARNTQTVLIGAIRIWLAQLQGQCVYDMPARGHTDIFHQKGVRRFYHEKALFIFFTTR